MIGSSRSVPAPRWAGDLQQQRHQARDVNVGGLDRWLGLLGGGGLALYGLSRRSLGGLLLVASGGYLIYRGLSGHCAIYERLGVNTAAPERSAGIQIEKSVTINRPVAEIYEFWRNFENLPCFMAHLDRVEIIDDRRSHWVAKVALPVSLEWDAEMTEDRANERIAWQSLPQADVSTRGWVEFKPAPGNRGTELKVRFEYMPPGGIAGLALAKLLNIVSAQQVKEDLRRLKAYLETGEIPTNDGQPSGRTELPAGSGQPVQSLRPSYTVHEDVVEEASWESFPASDSPAWTSRRTVGGAETRQRRPRDIDQANQ